MWADFKDWGSSCFGTAVLAGADPERRKGDRRQSNGWDCWVTLVYSCDAASDMELWMINARLGTLSLHRPVPGEARRGEMSRSFA